MATSVNFKLEAECSDLQADVLINGLPAFTQAKGRNTKNARINGWLIDGRNSIEVKVQAVEDVDPSAVSAYLSLVLTDNENSVYEFAWRPTDKDKPLPYSSRTTFISDSEFGEWAWQSAERLELNQETINDINRHIQRVYNALNIANVTETMSLFRVKAEEQAVAYGLSISERINEQRRFFEEWFRQPGWGMEPIDYDFLEYRLYAGNRVVLVRNKDGSDVLRSKPVGEGEMVSFPLFLSKINGQWTVVR